MDYAACRHLRNGVQLWRLLGREMGVLGVGVDEALGGAGGSFVDAAVVIEESGRVLMPVPAPFGRSCP